MSTKTTENPNPNKERVVEETINKTMNFPYATGVTVWFGKRGGCCLKLHRNRRTTIDVMTHSIERAYEMVKEMVANGE